jgi:type II secretory pathway pseudopilin PulG
LIEIIAVLAVIAILAAVLVPALLKQLDYAAGQSEVSALKRLGDGLRAGILKNRAIPDQSSWAQVIAPTVGLQTDDVLKNPRNVARVYLIDPALRIGPTNTSRLLAYTQSTNGSAAPVNARVMILSSLAQALPVSSGTNAAFDTIWNTADGAVPGDSAWSGYKRGDDLKIQRVNLAPVFHQLFLNNSTDSNCGVTFDGATNAITANAFSGHYLEGTVLSLYWTNTLVAQQVLTRDCGFTFDVTGWHGSLLNAPTLNGGGGGGGSGSFSNLDFIIPLFLATTNNPRSGESPLQVFTAMTNYMSTYKAWANAGFSASGPTFDAVMKSGTGSANVLDAATLSLVKP